MQYIIFGVIAVVGIVFLIIYNLRMDAKSKKAQAVEEKPAVPPPAESNVQEKASDDAKVLVADARDHGQLVEDVYPKRKTTKKDKTTDFEYREALRTFQSGDEPDQADKKDEEGALWHNIPVAPPEQKPDDQFREAIRSLKK